MKTKRVGLVFGAMRQNMAAEHQAQAELEVCDNVEMDEEGTWIKRPGLSRVTRSLDTGTWVDGSGGATFDGIAGAVIDGGDQCWSFDAATGQFRNRGSYERAYSREQSYRRPDGSVSTFEALRVCTVDVGAQKWVFVQTNDAGYSWFIVDKATRAMIRAPAAVGGASIQSLAVTKTADESQIWLFWVTGSTTINADKFTVASPGSPVRTTYQTTAGASWHSVDALLQTGGAILVVANGINATTAKYTHSYLDTATGAAMVTPAAVVVSAATVSTFVTPATNNLVHQSISILAGTLTGNILYTVWHQSTLLLIQASSASLVTFETKTLAGASTTGLTVFRGVASGYVAADNTRVVFSSRAVSTATIDQPEIERITWDGVTLVTNSSWANSGWVASRPVTVDGEWYVGTTWEKNRTASDTAAALQRTYYVRNDDGQIIARSLVGILRPKTTGRIVWPTTPDAQGDSTLDTLDFSEMAGSSNVGADPGTQGLPWEPTLIRISLSERFGRPVKYADGKVAVPAGVTLMFGAFDNVRELTPLMFPTGLVFALGTGSPQPGATGVAIVYRLLDEDGTISRSTPTIGSATFNDTGTQSITYDNLRIGSRLEFAEVEIYITQPGESDLRLMTTIRNFPTLETTTIAFDPFESVYQSTELLYTLGGRLSNAVAPQSHAVAFWRERLHLASDDFVFSSDEATFGFGPAFSEFKRRRYLGDDITALEPIDWNYLGAFKASGIAALSGVGPDNRGSGNYEIQELNTRKGVNRPRTVAQSIHGCHFTDAQDGQQCLVTSGLQIATVGDGVFDSQSLVVDDALHIESLRQLWLPLDDRILVLDYQHPTKEQPYGRWSEWKGSGYGGATIVQMFLDTAGPCGVSANGTTRRRKVAVYTDDTATSPIGYDQKMRTGEFPFAGLGGEYDIQEVLALLENVSGSTRTITLTLTSDRAEKTATDAFTVETTRRRIHWKPGGQQRCGGTKIQISDGISATAGYRLVGVIVQVVSDDHGKFPRTGDRS